MFERFRGRFEIEGSSGCSGEELLALIDPLPDGLADLMIRWAGAQVGGGLYRLHVPAEMPAMTAVAHRVFPEVAERALCFSVDWLGRQYAVDVGREAANGEPLLMMLDPSAVAPVEIDSVFVDFHDDDLVEYGDDILALGLFTAWLDAGGSMPEPGRCVSYVVPAHFGGADHPDNLRTATFLDVWNDAAARRAAALSD
jgi:hypothetical protein